ncbi:MAG: HD domain-containing protein [Sulfuricurvum sp.]|nr:HD domain-containing protein [Sulfuricurvum sp.]
MAKVVRKMIDNTYMSIKPDILVVGNAVPFDIYIKRFNDFVIIVEAGTRIDEELYAKIQQNALIYIANSESHQLKEYLDLHTDGVRLIELDTPDEPDIVADALKLKGAVADIIDLEKKVALVYSTTAKLMERIFLESKEKLPREALYVCVHEIAQLARTKTNILPFIIKLMPDVYTTHHHSVNVAFYTAILGNMTYIVQEELTDLTYAGLMHDIGKLRIDQKLLDKPSSLEKNEFELIKQHSQNSYVILTENGIVKQNILKGVLFHHERMDGSGYPQQIHGKMIPKMARIIGVCDVFDALTMKRTFRESYSSFEALLKMKREMTMQLDESLINLFIQLYH